MMLVFKLSWEYVSTRRNPQCYDEDGNPIIGHKNVPESMWETCEVIHTHPNDAAYQLNGTLKMMENGGLIRNVKLFQAVVQKPLWSEVSAVHQLASVAEVPEIPKGAVAP